MPALFISAYDFPLITNKAPRTARAINNKKKGQVFSFLFFSLKTMVARQAKRPTLSLMAGTWQGDPNGRPGGCGRGNVGLGVGHAAEGRSATRAHLGQTGELPRVNARASLLALMAPIGMRALFQPPQSLQRRDLTITSTYRRSWSAQPAREVGCSCTSISRLCSPRHAGGC